MSVKRNIYISIYIYTDISLLNKIILAFNLSVIEETWCLDMHGYHFSGPRNVALFMHINFKLGRMGKVFLSLFQSRTSQTFSTSLFVCCFIKANYRRGSANSPQDTSRFVRQVLH